MPRRGIKPTRLVVIRYVLPDGTRCKKGTPGARRTRCLTDTYYARLPPSRKPVNLGTQDLGQAWVKLRELQRQQAERDSGIRDTYTEAAAVPLAEHVEAWITAVRHRGATDKHCRELRRMVTHLADVAGWRRLADVTADKCLAALSKLTGRSDWPMASPQTRNHYLSACKQFLRWCEDEDRVRKSPLRRLRPVSVEADRRHDRCCPADADIERLFAYLASPDCPIRGVTRIGRRGGMTGPQRGLGYKVSLATGLRAAELRSLTPESFDLDDATVTVRAAYSKHRRTDVQPLPPWLVVELRAWFATGGQCWASFPPNLPGRILQADLKAAGVPYRREGPNGPEFLDMHALRYYYVSALANQPGISPKALMALCRHSTPTLTLKVYARARVHDLHAAVDQIPPIAPPRPPEAGSASG